MERRHRPAVGVALVVGLALAVIAVPSVGSLHSNHVEADAQVTANSTVVVESAYTIDEGFLVVHADDGGDPGESLGHAAIPAGEFTTGIQVPIEEAEEESTDARDLWLVLHHDTGGSGFDPAEDPPVESFGRTVADRFTLATGEGTTYVLARRFAPLTVGRSVRIPRMATGRPAHLVVHNATAGGPGAVVGSTHVGTGIHRNVSVALNATFIADRPETFELVAVVYRDDGDGEFDGSEQPVRAGNATVMTRFHASKGSNAPTPTRTTTTTGTAHEEETTNGEETTHHHKGETTHHHEEETTDTTRVDTPTGTGGTVVTHTGSTTAADPATDTTTGTATGLPGFTVPVTLAAVLLAGALAWRRRRG